MTAAWLAFEMDGRLPGFIKDLCRLVMRKQLMLHIPAASREIYERQINRHIRQSPLSWNRSTLEAGQAGEVNLDAEDGGPGPLVRQLPRGK